MNDENDAPVTKIAAKVIGVQIIALALLALLQWRYSG